MYTRIAKVLVQLRGYVDLARWLYFDFQPSDACRLAKLRLQETCDTPKERR